MKPTFSGHVLSSNPLLKQADKWERWSGQLELAQSRTTSDKIKYTDLNYHEKKKRETI